MPERTYYRGMRVADLAQIIGQCERQHNGDYMAMRGAYEAMIHNEQVQRMPRAKTNLRRQMSVIDFLREERRRGYAYSVRQGAIIRKSILTSAIDGGVQVAQVPSPEEPRS